jgi:hypothetical protein
VAEPPRHRPHAVTFGHLEACTPAHARPAGLYGYMRTKRSIASMLAASIQRCALRSPNTENPWRVMTKSADASLASTQWAARPLNDDMVVKADGRSRRASMAVQLVPGSLRGASGRCHAKTAQSRIGSGHKPLFRPYVTSAFPLRVVQRTKCV